MQATNDIPKRGEGNHEADADYRERTREFIADEDVEEHAEEAAEALDDPEEGPELEDARQKTKQGRK